MSYEYDIIRISEGIEINNVVEPLPKSLSIAKRLIKMLHEDYPDDNLIVRRRLVGKWEDVNVI